MENTDSEGFHYFSDQFLIQSEKQFSNEAKANSVIDSFNNNDRIMNSLSSDASCMSGQPANVEVKDKLNRASRISFNNPPVEMPLEISSKTRDKSVDPKGPNSNKDVIDDNVVITDDITIDPFNKGLSNSDSIYDSLDYNASNNIIKSCMYHKFIDSSYATED